MDHLIIGGLSVEMTGEIFTTSRIHKGIWGQGPTRIGAYHNSVGWKDTKVITGGVKMLYMQLIN